MTNSKTMETVSLSKGEYAKLRYFSLSNYRQLRTPFVFVDESGCLTDKADHYFGLGSFKIYRAPTLYPVFRSIRSKFQYKPELKFNRLSKLSMGPAKAFIRAAVENTGGYFKCLIIPKNDSSFDIVKYFEGDSFTVYKKFLVILLKKNINEIDLITVIADEYFTPFSPKKLESFEGGARALINSHYDRLALTGICQVSSHANDFIQLVDLLLGCVMLDLKIQKKIVNLKKLTGAQKHKYELLLYLKELLNMPFGEFFLQRGGVERKRYFPRSRKFEVDLFVPKEDFASNESGPSSYETTPAP